MIGEAVSRARVLDITCAEGVPGLYDVTLEDGTWITDLPTALTDALIRRNGTSGVTAGERRLLRAVDRYLLPVRVAQDG